jgi:hypothetical protein
MFGLDDKIKNAAAAGGTVLLTGALALLGVVWLSVAAVTALGEVTTPIAAMCIVGVAAMLPLAVTRLRRRPPRPEPKPDPVQTAEEATAIVRLAHSASLVAERAPVAGIALTLGAAFLAARSPTTSPLAVHMLAEAVERWLRSKEAAAAAAPNGPDQRAGA